jgi:hypothetical protein
MKSGTTYLQHVLAGLTGELDACGWHYPIAWTASDVPNHQAAFYDLLGEVIPWVGPEVLQSCAGKGGQLLDLISAGEGTVLLSCEALASLDEHGVDTCLALFGELPVEVVITVRDLARVIPSWWQQSLRNGQPSSFDEALASIDAARAHAESGESGGTFWRSFGSSDLRRRWADRVGQDRVTLVAVPRQESTTTLWERFRSAVGLPDEFPAVPPSVPREHANVSMTASEAVVMHVLMQRLADAGHPPVARARMGAELMAGALLDRQDRGPALGVPDAWLDRVADWSHEEVRGLQASGARLVGEWSDLLVDRDRAAEPEPTLRQVADVGAAIGASALPALGALRRAAVRAAASQPVTTGRRVAGLRRFGGRHRGSLLAVSPVVLVAAFGHFTDALPW